MNTLHGIITEIISEGHLSLVKVKIAGSLFCAVIVDTPATLPYLTIGNNVNVLFKENEVVIAKAFSGQISMQNKFDGIIRSIEQGKLLSSVRMEHEGLEIVSIITRQAAVQLNLSIGDSVTAMVKTNEISLSPYD